MELTINLDDVCVATNRTTSFINKSVSKLAHISRAFFHNTFQQQGPEVAITLPSCFFLDTYEQHTSRQIRYGYCHVSKS